MFYHVHIINGSIIAHSHPFNNNSNSQHSHSESECSIISISNHTYWSNDLYTVCIAKPEYYEIEVRFKYTLPDIVRQVNLTKSLRAPPGIFSHI